MHHPVSHPPIHALIPSKLTIHYISTIHCIISSSYHQYTIFTPSQPQAFHSIPFHHLPDNIIYLHSNPPAIILLHPPPLHSNCHHYKPLNTLHHYSTPPATITNQPLPFHSRFESMSFVVNILACKLKIVNNRN